MARAVPFRGRSFRAYFVRLSSGGLSDPGDARPRFAGRFPAAGAGRGRGGRRIGVGRLFAGEEWSAGCLHGDQPKFLGAAAARFHWRVRYERSHLLVVEKIPMGARVRRRSGDVDFVRLGVGAVSLSCPTRHHHRIRRSAAPYAGTAAGGAGCGRGRALSVAVLFVLDFQRQEHRDSLTERRIRFGFRVRFRVMVTTRSYIRSDRETVMNFMRGLTDGMDFYRDERNREKSMRFLSEYYRTNASDELAETINVYSRVTPGLPLVTAKSIENVIANDNDLSGMQLNAADMLDLSFLERLEEERKAKGR